MRRKLLKCKVCRYAHQQKNNIILLFFIFLFLTGRGCAEGATAPQQIELKPISAVPSPTQPQPVTFDSCFKFFKFDSQKLFCLTLASINANHFKIEEIQSKSGYVIFSVSQKKFLASVINVDGKNSGLKITPCNNLYVFPVGIVQNTFKYIELNANLPIEKLSVL